MERPTVEGSVVRLLGDVSVRTAHGRAGRADLPGGQVRTVLAGLALAGPVGVRVERLADLVWSGDPPRSWRPALRGVVLRLRRAVELAAPDTGGVVADDGAYTLLLPSPVRVDLTEALDGASAAEIALQEGLVDDAIVASAKVLELATGAFLPGATGRWVEDRRAQATRAVGRSLRVLARAHRARGQTARAVRAAREAVERSPSSESAHRLLMEMQAADGDVGEAIRTYERLRRQLRDELGISPSPATQQLYLDLLD